ncbi:MAG: sensor histidine kinase [Candidatus Promineifilaceae bacterium]
MSTIDLNTSLQESTWFRRAPWLILVGGAIFALIVAALLFLVLMQPPTSEMRALITTLGISSLLSLGIGYMLYRRGWARSGSLMRTLTLTYIWAALLTLINVGIMQQQMFVSDHDLQLSGLLLLFAAIIASSFGLFVSATVTDGLQQLAITAQQLAEGDLSARVDISGKDEVAQVGLAFNEMADQLETVDMQRTELENLRRDLIAWTSHDLRTPLTSIRVRVEALNDGVLDDPETEQRYYRSILSDVMALNLLFDDMFELAQLDRVDAKLEKSLDSLEELIEECLERFQTISAERGVQLSANVGEDVDPLPLNSAKISRVLDNLISNSLRYTPEGGRIVITADRDGDRVIVSVEDSGPGFNEEDIPRLFEQFYRGEQARTRATGGAGLGLSIAHGVVEAHGGRIWAENVPGGGARVSFELPG